MPLNTNSIIGTSYYSIPKLFLKDNIIVSMKLTKDIGTRNGRPTRPFDNWEIELVKKAFDKYRVLILLKN